MQRCHRPRAHPSVRLGEDTRLTFPQKCLEHGNRQGAGQFLQLVHCLQSHIRRIIGQLQLGQRHPFEPLYRVIGFRFYRMTQYLDLSRAASIADIFGGDTSFARIGVGEVHLQKIGLDQCPDRPPGLHLL